MSVSKLKPSDDTKVLLLKIWFSNKFLVYLQYENCNYKGNIRKPA